MNTLIPSGNLLHSELENHHFQWVNPLFRLGHGFNSYVSHYQRVIHGASGPS